MTVLRLPPRRTIVRRGTIASPPKELSELSGILAYVNKDDSNKEDLNVRISELEFTNRKTLAVPTKDGTREYSFNEWSFDQLASMLKIPSKYLNTCPVFGKGSMKDQIEARLEDKKASSLLLRVRNTPLSEGVGGFIRAVLGGSFQPYDNRHLIADVMRGVKEIGDDYQLVATNAHDPRRLEESLHLRMVRKQAFNLPNLPAHVDDPHQSGFHVSTSEIGACDLSLSTLIWRLICTNGLMGWGDAEVVRVKHRNFAIHEIGPRIMEGMLISTRQEASVADMLSRTYSEPVSDPHFEIINMGRRMKAPDAFVERTIELYRNNHVAQPTRYFVMQAFTEAARQAPLHERTKLEEMVGKAFFTTSRSRTRDEIAAAAQASVEDQVIAPPEEPETEEPTTLES